MASVDYRLCDKCECRVFYDATLDYAYEPDDFYNQEKPAKEAGEDRKGGYYLHGLGDWAVLCKECSTKFKTQIVEI